MQEHLDEKIEERIESGMNPEQARAYALLEFGNPATSLLASREIWTPTSLESFLKEVRYGIRTLLEQPGFSS